jgi:energy-coupling factor transporter ATP-binding protein EcfA2
MHSAGEMVRLLAHIRDLGKTIFVVTHQASLLEGAADEFVWMEFGKIVARTATFHPNGPTAAPPEATA